jgi:hypothetical protein
MGDQAQSAKKALKGLALRRALGSSSDRELRDKGSGRTAHRGGWSLLCSAVPHPHANASRYSLRAASVTSRTTTPLASSAKIKISVILIGRFSGP